MLQMPFQSPLPGQCKQRQRRQKACFCRFQFGFQNHLVRCDKTGYSCFLQDSCCTMFLNYRTALRSAKTMRLWCSLSRILSLLKRIALQINTPPHFLLHSVDVDCVLCALGPSNHKLKIWGFHVTTVTHWNTDKLETHTQGVSCIKVIGPPVPSPSHPIRYLVLKYSTEESSCISKPQQVKTP